MMASVEHQPRRTVGARWAHLPAAIAFLWIGLLASPAGFAIDRIVLEVDEVTAPGTQAAAPSITLDLARSEPVAHVRVAHIAVPEPIGPLRNVQLECTNIYVLEPKIECREGTLTADGGPTKNLSLKV